MKTPRLLTPRWIGAALLLAAASASAHISYTNRDFGTLVPGGPPVSLTGQAVTGSAGWADGTDDDFGDSHHLRAFRFKLETSAYVTLSFSGSSNGGTKDGGLKPAFSIYRGLAHLPPLTAAPGSPDYDTAPITLAWLASLPGPAKEGAFRALADWRVGSENQPGPAFDFEAEDGLSTFVYVAHAADGSPSLYGDSEGIEGDGNADGTVTKSLFLPAGDYSVFVGGADNTDQENTTSYGLAGTVSATLFNHVEGDVAEGGVPYAHQVTIGPKSAGHFSSHVGAWSWEDNALFDSGAGEPPVGWTHTSNWLALRVEQDMNLTLTLSRDANVPWPSPEEPDRKADTTSMFPSFTIWKNWDNDDGDHHTYNNRGNVDWAEDLEYLDHVDNATETTITRTYYLRAGDYTLALGSNAPATNPNRQGYKLHLATTEVSKTDPQANGIGYTWTVIADANTQGSFSSHVGAWSWEDNALFGNPGQSPLPVGWTHTSNWLALQLTEEAFFTLALERDANVPWPSMEDPGRLADTSSLFPSLTLWRGWDNDGGDHHTYNNRGNVAWAEDLRYLDHVDNSTGTQITRTWRLPAGQYSLALGSNAPATNLNRQGYKATFHTRAASNNSAGDPADGGIAYARTLSIGRGDSGSYSDHVGAWSWEDDSLFDAAQGDPPVGWTHTSRWVAVHIRDHVRLNLTFTRDPAVPWAGAPEELNGLADTTSLFPSFTLWRGWDNDGGDHHTYNNRGNIDWAEDLDYLDHLDNNSADTVTRSYTLAPGYYSLALGSNAPATNPHRQGFRFSWTTATPSLVGPAILQQPKSAALVEGKSVVFSVKAAGPDLEFQWLRNGITVNGATKPTLQIQNAGTNAAGAYICIVRNAAGRVLSQAAVLTVIAKPVVDAFDLPNLVVGQPFQLQLTATNQPLLFSAKGLPKGLVLDAKSGLIHGRPLVIGDTFAVSVTATNRAGTSAPVEDTLGVSGLRAGHGGSYTAPLERSVPLNGLLGGCVKFQITSLGSLTGTITLGGASPLRVAAPLDTSTESPTADFTLARKGLPDLHIQLTLDDATATLHGRLSDGTDTLAFEAIKPLPAAAGREGGYTLALAVQADNAGEEVPQGHSVGAFKISPKGQATGVLLLADASRAAFSGTVDQSGVITLFVPLYKGLGSVLGRLHIAETDSNLSGSEVSWFKGARPKDLVYGDGFGPLELGVIGRPYPIPAANEPPMGLPDTPGNAAIAFAEGGVADIGPRLDTNQLHLQAAKVIFTAPPPGRMKLTFDKGKPGGFQPGKSGSFKGSFELTDTDASVTPNRQQVRKAIFQGLIVDNGTELKGYGFFLLPQMPTASPKTTLATSPRLSGRVELKAD